ncbi:hypothetical protein GCM10029963_34290 [Micromonospora andamanensis]|nr:hypothetical protein Vwe01_41380 [Micromonospora andamanensis]
MPCGDAVALRSAVVLGTVAVVCLAGVPAAAVPTYVRDEPALAVAAPATVYLEATYDGYLRNKGGRLISRDQVTVTRRCSGAVVNPDGYVVTNTVCVRPSKEVLLVNALYRHGRALVEKNELAAKELDAYVGRLGETSVFTGRRRGSAPIRRLLAQVAPATADITSAPAAPAAVTAVLSPVDGNAALVKLQRAGLPAIEVGPVADPVSKSSLLILGFGRDEATDGSVRYVVRHRAVDVVGRTGTNRFGVGGEVGPDSRGGPVVDKSGRLVAILDTDTSDPNQPVRDLITTATINRLLAKGKVEPRLGAVDQAFRAALADYFAGRYSRAVGAFDAVLRQDASHTAARVYRARAQERLERDGDAVENSADWLLYLLSAAGGVLIIAGTTQVRRRCVRPSASTSGNGRRAET